MRVQVDGRPVRGCPSDDLVRERTYETRDLVLEMFAEPLFSGCLELASGCEMLLHRLDDQLEEEPRRWIALVHERVLS